MIVAKLALLYFFVRVRNLCDGFSTNVELFRWGFGEGGVCSNGTNLVIFHMGVLTLCYVLQE